MSALHNQVGGSHYKMMPVQPIEFSMMNRWDAASHSSLKYLSRYQDKGTAILDLEKAKHFIELRRATVPLARGKNDETFNWRTAMTMSGYVLANNFQNPTHVQALLALENVVHMGEIDPKVYDIAIHKIEVLISETKAEQHRALMSAGTGD